MLNTVSKFVFIISILSSLIDCKPPTPNYQWQIPQGFPEPIVPLDNPMSEAKVKLGEMLFFDVNLSFNQTLSCASCHQPQFAFAQAQQFAVGASGKILRRNTQALVNVAYNSNLTWAHSGLNSIEQQILIPMFAEDPIELGITGHEKEILERVNTEQYQTLSAAAFDNKTLNFELIVNALASYVRSLISFNSAFDRYAYLAEDLALSESAIRGMDLFFSERLECFHCHGGFNFTQASQHQEQRLDLRPFHNTGLYNEDGVGGFPLSDLGLYEVTAEAKDMGRFRAPTLRNVAYTAPYMHDGSLATLSDVIDFYAAGGREKGKNSPLKSPFIKGFVLQQSEKNDLLTFLNCLSDESFIRSSYMPQK
jgi:cytochrome c peroxidase